MKKNLIFSTLFLMFLFSVGATALPDHREPFGELSEPKFITWFPEDFTCPIDKTTNTFLVIGSYGSYIYSYPSKYQWLFFPMTDSPTYYICKKCHLTTFMWDFDKLPKEKLEDIKKALEGVKVSKAFKKYTELSVTERLEIMEKVYNVLGRDEEWWERFYRIKGYHYSSGEEADAARKKSLGMIDKFIKERKSEIPMKLLYYMSASMKHFTKDDEGALADLEEALTTKYQEKGASLQEIADAEQGLNERIKDYMSRIKSDKKPRDTATSDDDH